MLSQESVNYFMRRLNGFSMIEYRGIFSSQVVEH